MRVVTQVVDHCHADTDRLDRVLGDHHDMSGETRRKIHENRVGPLKNENQQKSPQNNYPTLSTLYQFLVFLSLCKTYLIPLVSSVMRPMTSDVKVYLPAGTNVLSMVWR